MSAANQVTAARFALTVVYFGLLTAAAARETPDAPGGRLLDAAFVLFVVAAVTDVLDGWLARRYGTVSSFGRVADPFVDKILVCGSMVYLAAAAPTAGLLPAWMVVCILAREFVVHGVRTQAEAQGQDFGASFWGKQKMFLQCVAIGGLLLWWGRLRGEAWLEAADRALVWVTLASTLVSGGIYLWQARRVILLQREGRS
jgi:CDP-diacylglycerol--glycerol-3-phosphate 3-phosphatidyltransferase